MNFKVPEGYYFLMSKDKQYVLCETISGGKLKICKGFPDTGYNVLYRKEKRRLLQYKSRIPNVEIYDWDMNPSPICDDANRNSKCVSVWMPESLNDAIGELAEERKTSRCNVALVIIKMYFQDIENGKEPFLATKLKPIEQEPTQTEKMAKIALKMRKIELLEDLWGISFDRMYENIDWEKAGYEKI